MKIKRIALSLGVFLGLVAGPFAASPAFASVAYWYIEAQALDYSTGKHLCITAESVGGYTELEDCYGSTHQQWAPVQSNVAGNVGTIWVSRSNPGYAMAWTYLGAGAHLTLTRASTTNHNELMVQGDPSQVSEVAHFRPNYLTSRCASPDGAHYHMAYAALYLYGCTSYTGSSESFVAVFAGNH